MALNSISNTWPSTNKFPHNSAIIFINNSKIFSDTQQYSAVEHKYTAPLETFTDRAGNAGTVVDVCRRINYGALVTAVCERHGIRKKDRLVRLYGSEPPPLKAVMENIKRVAQVELYERNIVSGKEKKTVTALVADAVETIMLRQDVNESFQDHYYESSKFLVLIGGDEGMHRLKEIAQEYGWSVKVWTYVGDFFPTVEQRREYLNLVEGVFDEENEVVPLQHYFDKVTFNEWEYDGSRDLGVLATKSLVIIFDQHVHWTNEMCTQVVNTACATFRLPVQGCFLKTPDDRHTDFLLVIRAPEQAFEYNEHIFSKFYKLKTSLESCPNLRIVKVYTIITYKKYFETNKRKKSGTEASAGVTVPRFELLSPPLQDEPDEGSEESKESAAAPANDSDEGGDGDLQEYSTVIRRRGRFVRQSSPNLHNSKPKRHFSSRCPYKFWCTLAPKCGHEHDKKEENFFRQTQHMPKKNRTFYKTQPCTFYPNCKFRGENSYLCQFWHEGETKRCHFCRAEGHFYDDCPKRTDKNEAALQ